MSKTSRTADCLIFAARSENRISWRWADVAARSIASMASAGSTAAAASSVSWVTNPRILPVLSSGKRLFPENARTEICRGYSGRPKAPGSRVLPGALGGIWNGVGGGGLGGFRGGSLGQRVEHALDLLDNFGVVLGVDLGEADHRARDCQLDVLEDLGAGDTHGLAGLVLGPYAAELAKGGSDNRGGLAGQGAGAEGAGQPVDGVLQRCRDGAVMLRRDQQDGVGLVGGGPQGGGGRGHLAFEVDVLVVEGDVAQALVNDHVHLFRGVERDGLGQLQVGGAGAKAADESEDGLLGHVYSCASRRGVIPAAGGS